MCSWSGGGTKGKDIITHSTVGLPRQTEGCSVDTVASDLGITFTRLLNGPLDLCKNEASAEHHTACNCGNELKVPFCSI